MTDAKAIGQAVTSKEGTSNTVTFRVEIPKDLPRLPATPSRPQTVNVADRLSA